jgi:DNA-binding MarR family transcriptional regulator
MEGGGRGMSLIRRMEREENLDVPSQEQRAANLLGALALAVQEGLEASLLAKSDRLSLNAAAALQTVSEHPGIQPVELQLVLGTTHSACVRIVNRLQRARLVRRCPDPSDGRGTCLEITPEGMTRVRAFVRIRDDFTRSLVKHVPHCWLPRMTRVFELFLAVLTPDVRSALRACRHCNWGVCGVDPGAPCPVVKAALLREATARAEQARAQKIPWWHQALPPDERPPLPPLDVRPRRPGPSQSEARQLLAIARYQAAPEPRQGRRRRWRR